MKMIALTGHRELDDEFSFDELTYRLEDLIKEGYTGFLCGMAVGFDLCALEALVLLKKKYSLYLEACIPYEGQERGYSAAEREKYRRLIVDCDRKTLLNERYFNGCFLARDRYMVDCADGVFAYLKKESGGTAYTVRYAKEKNKKVYFLRETGNFGGASS